MTYPIANSLPFGWDQIDEADPAWSEPYDADEPYDLSNELPYCGGSGCDGTCDTCSMRRQEEREAEASYMARLHDERDMYEADADERPYSYLCSKGVQHGAIYYSTQADWYEYITPSYFAPVDDDSEIPF